MLLFNGMMTPPTPFIAFLDGTSFNKPILNNTQIFMKFTFKGNIYDHDLWFHLNVINLAYKMNSQ